MATRDYRRHGLCQAKRLLNEYGSRAIDGRTSTGKALQAWRDTLVDDLGGPDAISAQQATLIEEAAKIKLLLSGIDAWLLSQDRPPVDKRSRRLWLVVKDTMALRNTLIQIMDQLGLDKHKPPAQDLSAYIEQRYGDGDGDGDT